jgi:hypothetical protein
MQGVDYPVLGISDTGDTQMMQPGQDYTYEGESVTEIPIMQSGGKLSKLKPAAGLDLNWDGQVEKADGSVGMWGSPIPIPKKEYRLYPKGGLQEEEVSYLKSLKNESINKALTRGINRKGEIPQWGAEDSDMFKQLLKNKPKKENGGWLSKYN